MPSGLASRRRMDSLGISTGVSILCLARCVGLCEGLLGICDIDSRLSLRREAPTIASFLGGEMDSGGVTRGDSSKSGDGVRAGLGLFEVWACSASRKSSGHFTFPSRSGGDFSTFSTSPCCSAALDFPLTLRRFPRELEPLSSVSSATLDKSMTGVSLGRRSLECLAPGSNPRLRPISSVRDAAIELPSVRVNEGASDVTSVVTVRIVPYLLLLLLPTSSKLENAVVSETALEAIDCRIFESARDSRSPTELEIGDEGESVCLLTERERVPMAQCNKPPSSSFIL